MPGGWTFVVVSSGVGAEKTGRVQSDYNRLSQAMQAIIAAWREKHPGDSRSLGELAVAGDVQRLRLPPELETRLDHFIAEDARVGEATEAFARGDVAAVRQLADASQSDADRLLGNQVPETGALVSLASAVGAAAASAFGAGWGGSVWALVKAADAEPFLAEWLAAYRLRYPHLRSAGFVSPPSGGVRRL
jgi:galactokinase